MLFITSFPCSWKVMCVLMSEYVIIKPQAGYLGATMPIIVKGSSQLNLNKCYYSMFASIGWHALKRWPAIKVNIGHTLLQISLVRRCARVWTWSFQKPWEVGVFWVMVTTDHDPKYTDPDELYRWKIAVCSCYQYHGSWPFYLTKEEHSAPSLHLGSTGLFHFTLMEFMKCLHWG